MPYSYWVPAPAPGPSRAIYQKRKKNDDQRTMFGPTTNCDLAIEIERTEKVMVQKGKKELGSKN